LLHGPPGCAKTTLARAAAGSESVSFLSLSPADVFSSSYVGEAEAKIRKAFDNARAAAPCVLFFDEIDAIVGSNAGGGGHNMNRSGGGASAESRVLSTFLNETDGLTTSKGDRVLVIGATNRPSTLDAALLRPGRFDKVIYVPPPDYDGRLAFIKSLLQQMGTLQDVHETDLRQLASHEVSGKMTGAEISGAVREAAARFLRESLTEGNTPKLKAEDLEKALRDVKPLLMDDQILEEYAAFERSRKFH
jgi:SpoVK/Ycf46/Vps4 family AAA+-type ATPase